MIGCVTADGATTNDHSLRMGGEIAAALEALFDGTWLNILLYPEVFKRAHAERHVKDYLGLVFTRQCLD